MLARPGSRCRIDSIERVAGGREAASDLRSAAPRLVPGPCRRHPRRVPEAHPKIPEVFQFNDQTLTVGEVTAIATGSDVDMIA